MSHPIIDRLYIKNPRLRRWVTTLLEGKGEQQVELFGSKLTIDVVKEHGYLRASRLARRSSLFRDEIAVLMSLSAVLDDVDTFIDIGANVGLFSVMLSKIRQVRPLECHAFEANPDTYARLQKNAAAHGVIAHNVALSNEDGEKRFVAGAVSHVFTTVEHQSAYSLPAETMTLPCRRLDGFSFRGHALALKIDVEGQEREVLQGAEALFDRVRVVYVDGFSDHAIIDMLRARGFAFYDGRSLAPTASGKVFSLLALKQRHRVA